MPKTCPEPSWANIWVRNLGVEERESKREGKRRVRRKGGKVEDKEGREEGGEGRGREKEIPYGTESHQGVYCHPHVSGEKTGTHSV